MTKDKSRKKVKKHRVKPATKPAAVTVVNNVSGSVIPEKELVEKAAARATNTAVNICDECAYEFGSCEGIPKFASEIDATLKGTEADRVIECKGFFNVQSMPTDDQLNQESIQEDDLLGMAAGLVAAESVPGATEEAKKDDAADMAADLKARQKHIQRFQREEDLGNCSSCDRPLKRTAFNRYRDAVRCTNPRCRQYRAVVRNIPAN